MKKWLLTINRNNYMQTISVWGKSKEEVKNKWENYAILHIDEDLDLQHQSLIANMKFNSTFLKNKKQHRISSGNITNVIFPMEY